MKKIIALDLDGTLLDSSKRLSSANRDALAAAAEKGALVVPTTGRFFDMMPQCIRDLPFVRYAITINGAQVFDRETDRTLVREEIPIEEAVTLMERLDRYDAIYDCYRAGWGWMTESFKAKAEAYATDGHYLKMIREFRNGVPELKAHLLATPEDGGVQKVMLFTRLDGPKDAATQIAEETATTMPRLKVTSSTWNNIEFNAASAHKGMALKRFAEALGMTAADCIAFGDGMNDLTMIETAGIGVAMANACQAVKTAADFVTLSNDEDGVAVALREFGLA